MPTRLGPYFKTHGWPPSPPPHRRRLPALPTQRGANPRLMVIIGLRSPPASRSPHWSAFALPHLRPIPTHPSRSSNPTGAYVRPRPRRILSQVSRRHGWATRCVRRFPPPSTFTLMPLLAYIQSFIVEFPRVAPGPQDEPARVLFDPIFSQCAGPSPWVGIQRRLPPPCTVAELPDFQFVVYSHNQCVLPENHPP